MICNNAYHDIAYIVITDAYLFFFKFAYARTWFLKCFFPATRSVLQSNPLFSSVFSNTPFPTHPSVSTASPNHPFLPFLLRSHISTPRILVQVIAQLLESTLETSYSEEMRAAWKWLWIWLTESMHVVEQALNPT